MSKIVRLVDYRIIIVCISLTIALWLLIGIGLIQPTLRVLEIAAVVITALFTLGLVGRFALTRHLFILWAAGFMAIAMIREIHFSGSDEILIIGWPILLGIAVWRYDLFENYFKNPVLINFLAGGILFYLISQTIDQRWWRGLPGEGLVHGPLEELIEVLAHCTAGVGMLFCKEARQSDDLAGATK